MATDSESSRREFLGTLSAGMAAAGAIATPTAATAQSAAPLKIVDFHNHYISPSWSLTNLERMPAAARASQEKINANMQSESALLTSSASSLHCAARSCSRKVQRAAGARPA